MVTDEWVSDANGNRCSVAYFGSVKAAKCALNSLRDCHDCTNCLNCSGCLNCSDCSGCSDCSDCSDCSGCSRCSDCSDKKAAPVLVPAIPDIDKAVYAAALTGLNMSTWHGTCGTTHCRAGWVVTLAGDAGTALERRFNTELAAMLIYRESGAPINLVRFYDTNGDALADMKARAEE